MKFIVSDEESKNILEMHSKMKNNRSIIVEQTTAPTEDPNMTKLKSAISAGCLTNGGLKRNKTTGQVFYRKPSAKDPSKEVDFYADMTYKFVDGTASGKWKCDGISQSTPTTPQVNQQQLTPQQQKNIDDLINFYNKGPEPRYKKEEPTADQMAKKEWAKVNLKEKPEFNINFDYYVWEKTGLRQTQSPQQRAAIKTYTDAGWQDIGGKVNPAEAAKYDTIDLKDIYGDKEFPESYKLVKTIDSVDTNEIIKELNDLVGTKNFGDRKTCRDIISKYNVAKQKNAPINDALLRNWKMAVNACKTKVSNFNDLNTTKTILGKLATSETEIDKRWNIDITKPSVTPPAGATPPAP